VRDSVVIQRTEDEVTSVEAVPPTWRDVWAILRGTYRPKVRVVSRLTVAGTAKMLKEVWGEPVREALNAKSHLFDYLEGK
jgi:hypothetical protein